MRLLASGLLGCLLISGAKAQWYPAYPPPYPGYYPPYENPNVTWVYPPPVRYSPPPMPIVVQEPYWQPRRITYRIAFNDSLIRLAVAYWVKNNTLYYVMPDHQQKSAPLGSVDRALTERLNSEQGVPFYLPPQSTKAELRKLLEQQLKLILETRNTSRGLVVQISDVLFEFNEYKLTPTAREKLSKLAGILVSYQGLCPHLEGYTDSVGGDQYNLQLSRKRAEAVRDYLISQGVTATNLTAEGLGKFDPVASNTTAAGRQQNRRVEMLISGEAIGVTATSASLE
jgi:outer membrane protein OmpA-like peptidoglycan-associated protein